MSLYLDLSLFRIIWVAVKIDTPTPPSTVHSLPRTPTRVSMQEFEDFYFRGVSALPNQVSVWIRVQTLKQALSGRSSSKGNHVITRRSIAINLRLNVGLEFERQARRCPDDVPLAPDICANFPWHRTLGVSACGRPPSSFETSVNRYLPASFVCF